MPQDHRAISDAARAGLGSDIPIPFVKSAGGDPHMLTPEKTMETKH